MYKLDQAEVLVEYYKFRLLDKKIKPLEEEKKEEEEEYLISNVVLSEIADHTFSVYCVTTEGKETLSIRDIKRVAEDHGLLSPSQVLKHYNL